MREVFINKQRVDVNENNVEGYIFSSPIFQNIESILSNRTANFKLPKTQNNINIIKLSDTPDIVNEFPDEFHEYEEWRDGLLFIKGQCRLLSCTKKDITLFVVWGDINKLAPIREMKLRELIDIHALDWNSESKFMDVSSESKYGFLRVDFGRGFDDMQYILPSVNVSLILDLITESTGVHFAAEERFVNAFKRLWIPLLETNASKRQCEEAQAKFFLTKTVSGLGDEYVIAYPRMNGKGWFENKIIDEAGNLRVWWQGEYKIRYYGYVYTKKDPGNNKLAIASYEGENVPDEKLVSVHLKDFMPCGDRWRAVIDDEFIYTQDEHRVGFVNNPDLYIATQNGKKVRNLDYTTTLVDGGLAADPFKTDYVFVSGDYSLKLDSITFGMPYYITPNLPDMKVIDFLKSIMWQFGLFAHYDKKSDNTIRLVSIDDIYNYKSQAFDWTNKIADGDDELTFQYSNFAQKNYFKYSADDNVRTNADSVLEVNSRVLEKEKNLITLPYSPTDNVTDDKDNTYVKINLFDEDGNTNNIKTRIVREWKYNVSDNEDNPIPQKSGIFHPEQMFSYILPEYYSGYHTVIQRIRAVMRYVYLDSYDLAIFDPAIPIFIDGAYYMPINVTVMQNGLTRLMALKMHYKKP
ncbi:hypothetical protein M2132_001332 [Dysgonomonas sp. PH5-45]|uniref:hypothetical protein n=1 Tax=unclassified Dysgonomonas TaxID=2630389 RepID=UPI0024746DEC|nr:MULTISPECIES: hypothetical protein [unclassified Dysgonomonas]MDH6354995.1 hypothetical protein [Dysgonomonas sp. PH5-45]MDH6387881.1 hypothetical protein [Dysgonomonas sp. PH5-37]